MKTYIVQLENCWVHLPYDNKEETEEDGIQSPLLHPLPNPQLGDRSIPPSILVMRHVELLC